MIDSLFVKNSQLANFMFILNKGGLSELKLNNVVISDNICLTEFVQKSQIFIMISHSNVTISQMEIKNNELCNNIVVAIYPDISTK